jgi:hypothetical protein
MAYGGCHALLCFAVLLWPAVIVAIKLS